MFRLITYKPWISIFVVQVRKEKYQDIKINVQQSWIESIENTILIIEGADLRISCFVRFSNTFCRQIAVLFPDIEVATFSWIIKMTSALNIFRSQINSRWLDWKNISKYEMRDDGEGLYFSDLGPVDSSLVLNICTEISCLTGNSALLLSLLDVPLNAW